MLVICWYLRISIHRGTHLCPTPLAHTREESRTLHTLKDCQQYIYVDIVVN